MRQPEPRNNCSRRLDRFVRYLVPLFTINPPFGGKNTKWTCSQLRTRQAVEYRSLEDDYRQRHQMLQEAHEHQIHECIRRHLQSSTSLIPTAMNSAPDQDKPLNLATSASSNASSMSDIHASTSVSAFQSRPLGAPGLKPNTLPLNSRLVPSGSNYQSPSPVGSAATPHPVSPTISDSDCSGCSYSVRHKLHVRY